MNWDQIAGNWKQAKGKVKARVRVDLIGLPEGFATDAKPVTVERIQAELPRAFRGMAAQLKDDEASRPTKEAYLLLAGPEAGPPGWTLTQQTNARWLLASTTAAPACARVRANCAPSPLDAPVMKATRPERSMVYDI